MADGAEPRPGDALSGVPILWIWVVIFGVVAVSVLGLTEWDVLERLLENRGLGAEEASMLGFVGGYTLPLTAGVAVSLYLYLTGAIRHWDVKAQLATPFVVLFVAGLASAYMGLGL